MNENRPHRVFFVILLSWTVSTTSEGAAMIDIVDFEPHLDDSKPPKIPLPEGWPELTLAAVLHVIAVARLAILSARYWPGGECSELRLRAENDRLRSEVELLKQEIAIKDARFATIDPQNRPRYSRQQRLAILVLKSARGWSTAQVAKRFHVTTQTIRNWMKASTSLVEFPEKVTRYPDYLRFIIQQLKGYCPFLGRRKIADILTRTGLHISASTIRRIINEPPIDPEAIELPDEPDDSSEESSDKPRTMIAKYANHVWSVDLTLVPIDQGFWVPWSPNSLPQKHPYCWHVLNVVDHFSRRLVGYQIFHDVPTAEQVLATMDKIMVTENAKPKYIISDRGKQFDCKPYRKWCKSHDIKPRYGAVGKHGSIAVTERYHRTLKTEFTRRILVPTSCEDFNREMNLWKTWYNGARPHDSLKGRTPDEVYFGQRAANTLPRIEPRPKVSHRTPCAKPRMMYAGRAGAKIHVELSFLEDRPHLPIITTTRV